MRTRITILCGFLLFSVMFVTPAQAGPWSSFISWLSDLDPKTRGAGLEFLIVCTPQSKDPSGPSTQEATIFGCGPTERPGRTVLKGSAAFLLGTLNDNGGTIFAAPVLVIVERQQKNFYYGAGAGVINVGGTLKGGITRGLFQVNVTYPIPKVHIGVRAELNVIAKGFPAGAFSPTSAETGTEKLLGISIVYIR